MQLLTPFFVMMRARQLGRQFRDIERSVRALPKRNRERLSTLTLREIGQASRTDFPHLYGTAPEVRYLPWGQGTDAGYERACSTNAEVALRGIALWLAVAYQALVAFVLATVTSAIQPVRTVGGDHAAKEVKQLRLGRHHRYVEAQG
jgi:hypothetical protein